MATRLKVSATAEQHLNQWAEALTDGSLQLWELPPSVAQFFYLGWGSGRAEWQPEIDRLNHQLDVLYMRSITPQERQDEYRRRLEAHFEREADRALAPMHTDSADRAGQSQSISTPVDPANIAEIEGKNDRSSGTTRPDKQAA